MTPFSKDLSILGWSIHGYNCEQYDIHANGNHSAYFEIPNDAEVNESEIINMLKPIASIIKYEIIDSDDGDDENDTEIIDGDDENDAERDGE